jgi:hypothetical protein
MKRLLPILILAVSVGASAEAQTEAAPTTAPDKSTAAAAPASPPAIPMDQENARKAKALLEQAIQALGGPAYLNIRDREQQGRAYSFHHGRPTSNGVLFWGFSEFPDKERTEVTKERDVAQVYVGTKGYEITYKGAHPMEEKDLIDYLRRRRFSLDTILRTWVNDPTVALLFEGNALAAQHPALQVTLINAKNESVTLFLDADTHLPVKKSFEWRDPVDRQKNVEEEIYENYRVDQGVTNPHNVSRYFNGDMAGQRFLNSVTFNQGLDPAMFDPNSGYKPKRETGRK